MDKYQGLQLTVFFVTQALTQWISPCCSDCRLRHCRWAQDALDSTLVPLGRPISSQIFPDFSSLNTTTHSHNTSSKLVCKLRSYWKSHIGCVWVKVKVGEVICIYMYLNQWFCMLEDVIMLLAFNVTQYNFVIFTWTSGKHRVGEENTALNRVIFVAWNKNHRQMAQTKSIVT